MPSQYNHFTDPILTFDPGGISGVCLVDMDNHLIRPGYLRQPNHHRTLYKELEWYAPKTIVTERFDYRPKQKHVELISVEYIGVMRLYCQMYNVPLIEQPQLKGKHGLWTDDKLKVLGLYTPGEDMDHCNDAVRQALYYATTTLKDMYWIERYGSLTNANIL